MKKIVFALGAIALCLASCKKDRTCECTNTHTNFTGTTSSKQTTTYKKVKKSEAKKMCQKTTVSDNSTTNLSNGGTIGYYTDDTYDCKLK